MEESYLSERGCIISKRALRSTGRGSGGAGKLMNCLTVSLKVIDLSFTDYLLVSPNKQRSPWYAYVAQRPTLALHSAYELEGTNDPTPAQRPPKQRERNQLWRLLKILVTHEDA